MGELTAKKDQSLSGWEIRSIGTILAGTGAGTGYLKNDRISGQPEPEPDIRYIPIL